MSIIRIKCVISVVFFTSSSKFFSMMLLAPAFYSRRRFGCAVRILAAALFLIGRVCSSTGFNFVGVFGRWCDGAWFCVEKFEVPIGIRWQSQSGVNGAGAWKYLWDVRDCYEWSYVRQAWLFSPSLRLNNVHKFFQTQLIFASILNKCFTEFTFFGGFQNAFRYVDSLYYLFVSEIIWLNFRFLNFKRK